MAVDVLLGLQWGDEGKGKIVDYLAPKYKVVARFQGGPNAGHTLLFEGIKHVLHQVPSGIFREDIENIIGNGVVLDPVIFAEEITKLKDRGLDPTTNLFISKKTQMILPTHKLLDAAYEKQKGDKKIGSTLKGIGPTYQDKIGRTGLRVGDILTSSWMQKYEALRDHHLSILDGLSFEYSLEEFESSFFYAVEKLKSFRLIEGEHTINEALGAGKSILAEGAQGSLLDIDFGTYPFVTSSNTMVAGACTGLGVAPSRIGEVFGIFKAYCTRVGSGPFPTELFDDTGEELRSRGHEFGATTGRPRRCGWLDLPALRYAIMINGVTQLFMMKADVLSGFDEIKICTHYEGENGEEVDRLTYEGLEGSVKPVYRSFPGWTEDLRKCSSFNELPSALIQYIEFIESAVNVPVNIVSTGPDRTETIIREAVSV
jgi:adenylosuccinate synthase